MELSSTVQKDTASKGLRVAFEEHALKLLSLWETVAAGAVSKDIAILKEGDPVSSADAADRIAKVGEQGRGSALALARTLGDGRLIMPGDISRLFGAKPFTAGRRAAVALMEMNEAGVLALVFAASHDFQDKDSRDAEYRKQLSFDCLKTMTGQSLPADSEAWIRWFTGNPDTWVLVRSTAGQDQSNKKDVGNVSTPPWVKNEFFWCLVVAAVIYFIVHQARKK